MSRPTRSVRYKAISKLPCTKCEMLCTSGTQLTKHKKLMHTSEAENSFRMVNNIPMVDNLSLLDISNDDTSAKAITLEESVNPPIIVQDTITGDKSDFVCITGGDVPLYTKSKHGQYEREDTVQNEDIVLVVDEEAGDRIEQQIQVPADTENEFSYQCGQCGNKFRTFDECNNHVNSHSFKCYRCEFEMQSQT